MEKIEAQKRYAAKEACKAETAKREAEELSKRDELEILERIEREKHDIECEKIEAAEEQRKGEREAPEMHNQLLYEMEKAKLVLEQDRINLQQFQQQRDYEFKCQLQDRQHEDELEKLEAPKALTQTGRQSRLKHLKFQLLTKVETRWIPTY